jgi:hypothetical protein
MMVKNEELLRNRPVDHLRGQHRTFLVGIGFGLVVAVIKFAIVLPVDLADGLYGSALLITLVVTLADLLGLWDPLYQPKAFDFVLGLLYPLDAYAVLILFGFPLPD